MIGLLILSHGSMAESLCEVGTMLVGPLPNCQAKGLFADMPFAEWVDSVQEALCALDEGDGVLVLTDLFGASPYHAAAKALHALQWGRERVRVVSGVNVAMLLEALLHRTELSLDELAHSVQQAGRAGVQELFDTLLEVGREGDSV